MSIEPELFRKKKNLWLAYGSEAISPLLRMAASARSGRKRIPRDQWRRGLIISHTHIGDILYRTCSLPYLREYLPQCSWTYAVAPESAEVLRNNPDIAEVLPIVVGEDSWNLSAGGFAALKKRDFDVVLCSNTLRHYPDLALASALGIPERFAFSGKGFSGLINHPVEIEFPAPYPSYFRTMVAALVDRPGDWALRPRLFPGDNEKEKAEEIWSSLGLEGSTPVVACSLRTRQASGGWPDEVMISILEEARSHADFEILLCGTAADAAYLKSVQSELRYPSRITAGDAGLLEFAALLGKCAALLTLDSGPRHIGNAMGIPVVFARNLWQSMVETGRYCDSEIDLGPSAEYLDDIETDRVVRSLPVGLLADKLLEALSGSLQRAALPR